MEAVFFEQQSRRSGRSDSRMVLYYACANTECGFRWTDSVDNKPKDAEPQDEENNIPEYIEDDSYMNDIYNTQELETTFQGSKLLVFFCYKYIFFTTKNDLIFCLKKFFL